MAYKQHFVEWFSGKQLPSYWTGAQVAGSGGSASMADAIDGGINVNSGSGSNNSYAIDFNNKRQYSATGSVMINVSKINVSTNYRGGGVGMSNVHATNGNNYIYFQNTASNTYIKAVSRSTSSLFSDTSVTQDANYHSFKGECKSSSVEFTIDGGLQVTHTTNLPTLALQPFIYADDSSSVSADMRCIYCEAYNT